VNIHFEHKLTSVNLNKATMVLTRSVHIQNGWVHAVATVYGCNNSIMVVNDTAKKDLLDFLDQINQPLRFRVKQ
jgi:hypothetical protein